MRVTEVKALDQMEKDVLEKVRIESDGVDGKFSMNELPRLVLVEVVDPPTKDADPVYLAHDRNVVEQLYEHEEVPEETSEKWVRDDDKGYASVYGKGELQLWSGVKSINYTKWDDNNTFSYEATAYAKESLIATKTVLLDIKVDYATALENAINALLNEHVNTFSNEAKVWVLALDGKDLCAFEDTPNNTKDSFPSITSLNPAIKCDWAKKDCDVKGSAWVYSKYQVKHTKVPTACTHKVDNGSCAHPFQDIASGSFGYNGSAPAGAFDVVTNPCNEWNDTSYGYYNHKHRDGQRGTYSDCGWNHIYGCYVWVSQGNYTHTNHGGTYNYYFTNYRHKTAEARLAADGDWHWAHNTDAEKIAGGDWVCEENVVEYEGSADTLRDVDCNSGDHTNDVEWITVHGKLDTIQAAQPNRGCNVSIDRNNVQLSLSGSVDGIHSITGIAK